MAISCEPADLAELAKCFRCLQGDQREAVKTYLLAVIAGGSTDPATLLEAAKCFYAQIPTGMQKAVQTYLLCQIVNK